MDAQETSRLILTPAVPALAEALADYHIRNRAFLAPFEPAREASFFTPGGQHLLLAEEARLAARGLACRFYLARKERPEEIIGMAGLSGITRGAFQSCFLSYRLDAALLNRGYMTEAVLAVVDNAFRRLGLHRIEANIMPRNAPSLRVAEKAGFVSEGLARKYLNINGVWEDHIHMVRLNEPTL